MEKTGANNSSLKDSIYADNKEVIIRF